MKLSRLAVYMLLLAATASCANKTYVATVPPELSPRPPLVSPPAPSVPLPAPEPVQTSLILPEPPPPPAEPPTITALAEADRAFDIGEYARAAQHYENYLLFTPNNAQRDRVLFRLALSYMLPEPPARDWEKGMQKLKQIINDYPTSPHQPAALALMRLRSQVNDLINQKDNLEKRVDSLSKELDRIKQIDERSRLPRD